MFRSSILMLSILLFPVVALATVPKQINHQGVVSVNGNAFEGTGLFRFAIIDDDSGINLWSNDGTIVGAMGGIPTAAVSLSVSKGVYSVSLGDTGLINMTEIASSTFNSPNTVLRIWFDDSVNGIQQLAPDHKLTASPYSHRTATMPPIGSIVAWHKNMTGVPSTLPAGWVECNGPQADDPTTPVDESELPDLNSASGFAGGRFLRGGTTSGVDQDASAHVSNHFDRVPVEQSTSRMVVNEDGTTTTGQVIKLVTVATNSETSTSSQPYSYSRPVNMSVVWIMRVK